MKPEDPTPTTSETPNHEAHEADHAPAQEAAAQGQITKIADIQRMNMDQLNVSLEKWALNTWALLQNLKWSLKSFEPRLKIRQKFSSAKESSKSFLMVLDSSDPPTTTICPPLKTSMSLPLRSAASI